MPSFCQNNLPFQLQEKVLLHFSTAKYRWQEKFARKLYFLGKTYVFDGLMLNIPTQSVIFSGLRGVGKTVLINRLQTIAEEKGIFCRHIEVEERNDFISQIASCSQAFLRKISTVEKFKHLIQKPLDAIKALVVSFAPGENTFSLSVQERELYTTVNLTQSLTDVFCTIGEAAGKAETPICFFIDEIQYMKSNELGALIAALHRANQLGYPVMIVGAGLPKIYSMLSEEKSYSERLFVYKEIGSLEETQAREAIEKPAEKMHVRYTDDAVTKIIRLTKGYPFFIQQLCQIVYQNTSTDVIDGKCVEKNVEEFLKTLDKVFFKVRYERCSEADKKFIFAMTACGGTSLYDFQCGKNNEQDGKLYFYLKGPVDQQRNYLFRAV